ncbi:ATP-binding protein [Anaerolineales bacterium HSG25]|nr:ATP-binding protein [Anaerolineales bacterium HSG25]
MTPVVASLLLFLLSLFYLFVALMAVSRRGFRENSIRLLTIFLVIAFGWELLHAALTLFNPSGEAGWLLSEIPINGVVLLAFLYFLLSRVFLRLSNRDRTWRIGGIIVMMTVLLLRTTTFLLLPANLSLAGLTISQSHIRNSILILGWVIFMGGVVLITYQTYRQAPNPLHRNRIKYWVLSLILLLCGDLFLFSGLDLLSSGFRLAGIMTMAYAIRSHRLRNVNQLLHDLISYLIITLLTASFYLFGFVLVQYVSENGLGNNLLLTVVLISLVLALVFNPLQQVVQKLVDRWWLGRGYDANQLVRDYSANISTILSLHRLGIVSLEMIQQTFRLEHATMFLVKQKPDQDRLCLQRVHGLGRRQLNDFYLRPDSPVVAYFQTEHRPLGQYELDMSSEFAHMPKSERAMLTGFAVDVYVPIYAKNEWLGLFALGAKRSRKTYFDHDLSLLSTLADQTAVALQNALLVDNLVALNKDLKTAYADLDHANQQLQELDNLKSAFIGVITHEMRSPFINIDFSVQLLERYGLEHLVPEQVEQLGQLKLNIKEAKQMVDNLVNFATFLSNRADLFLSSVNLSQLLGEAVTPHRDFATKKQIRIYEQCDSSLDNVSADQQRLRNAVSQLVHNAVKFTNPGGEVWVRCVAQPDTVRIEIQDTGIGVDPEILPHLWDDFTQTSDSLRRGVEGLGLGLTLVKYVATAHGGTVFATSQIDQGSTFGFEIPL